MLQEAVRVHALVQSLSSPLEGHFYPVGSSLRLDNTSFSKETRGH